MTINSGHDDRLSTATICIREANMHASRQAINYARREQSKLANYYCIIVKCVIVVISAHAGNIVHCAIVNAIAPGDVLLNKLFVRTI